MMNNINLIVDPESEMLKLELESDLQDYLQVTKGGKKRVG